MVTLYDAAPGNLYLKQWLESLPGRKYNAAGEAIGGPGNTGLPTDELDQRLSLSRTYVKHGIPAEIVHSRLFTIYDRMAHMIACHPECLHIDPDMVWGEFFHPITQRDLDEEDPWLYNLITKRVESSMYADRNALLTGGRLNPQPSGRYYCITDFIQMWNTTGGICACGQRLYLHPDHITAASDEMFRYNSKKGKAEVQRKDNSIIHLASNLCEYLTCAECAIKTSRNVNEVHTRRAGGAASGCAASGSAAAAGT